MAAYDYLRKLLPGDARQAPSAARENAWTEAAIIARQYMAGRREQRMATPLSPGAIWVRNDTGSARSRGEVVGLGASLVDQTENVGRFLWRPVVEGVTPTAAAHAKRFGVLLSDPAADAMARVQVTGICRARVQVEDDSHGFATVKDGDPSCLISAASGAARIISRKSGTGLMWAWVDLGGGSGGGEQSFLGIVVPGTHTAGICNVYPAANPSDPYGDLCTIIEDVALAGNGMDGHLVLCTPVGGTYVGMLLGSPVARVTASPIVNGRAIAQLTYEPASYTGTNGALPKLDTLDQKAATFLEACKALQTLNLRYSLLASAGAIKTAMHCASRENGSVIRVVMTNGGTGYKSDDPPAVVFGSPSSGEAALGIPVIDNTAGKVTGVVILYGGYGYSYSSPPSVSFQGGSGQNAAAVAVVGSSARAHSGVVRTVTVISGGSGYTTESPPVVTIAAPSYGVQATATAVVTNGSVTAITVVESGYGYNCDSPPTVVITGGNPGGATARAVVEQWTSSKPLGAMDCKTLYPANPMTAVCPAGMKAILGVIRHYVLAMASQVTGTSVADEYADLANAVGAARDAILTATDRAEAAGLQVCGDLLEITLRMTGWQRNLTVGLMPSATGGRYIGVPLAMGNLLYTTAGSQYYGG